MLNPARRHVSRLRGFSKSRIRTVKVPGLEISCAPHIFQHVELCQYLLAKKLNL